MVTSTSPDTLAYRIGSAGEFRLRIPAGDIEIHGTDDDTVVVRDRDGGDLASRFEVAAEEGRLDLRTRDHIHLDVGFRFGTRGPRGFGSIAVDVPRRARVVLETASADVRVEGLRGEQRYRTASGQVDVRGGSGRIVIDVVSGEFTAALDGDAELTGRTVSGDVTIRGGRLRALTLSTTSGDIEIYGDLAGDGPFSVQTVSGDASITSRTGIELDGRTITGEISSEGADHSGSRRGRSSMAVGDGATRLAFKSISGDLHLASSVAATGTAPFEAAPVPPVHPAAAEAATPAIDDRETQRLSILRDLEDGRIDVDAAASRLGALDEADR